jgi:hypothetical protein
MFKDLKQQVQNNFAALAVGNLFYVDIDRDLIFEKYLEGFSDDTKQSHTCNCCKSFLRQYAGIVGIVDNKRVSIWDNITVDAEYQQSVDNLREYIHSLPITDIFLNDFAKCGTNKNYDKERDVIWEHFFIELPARFVNTRNIDTERGAKRTLKEVFMRALEELTIEATETVLDLISQNSLYRGKESEGVVTSFLALQKEYVTVENKENFCWTTIYQISESLARIRNTAMGTLLIDLSEGVVGLDIAVEKFEKMMAGTNYKRSTAVVTPKMVEMAKEKLAELGLMNSLERRYANETDLNVEDVLYTDKSSSLTDVFGEMSKEVEINPRTLSKVEEISIDAFINNVLPHSKSIEALVENSHLPNFLSIVTAVDKGSPSLFKWNNNFSWSYTGGITDSIKERVKQAGGNVEGELRISLSWYNYDDLDLHVIEPNGNRIYYANKCRKLDVDMNAGQQRSKTPVENVIFQAGMQEGRYKVHVNNFSKREAIDIGFEVQIECRGEVYDIASKDSITKDVVYFTYTKAEGIKFETDIKSQLSTKDKWGLKTNQFVKVRKMMLSPNHWNSNTGNKHYMFLLDKCVSDESARPFFNEFLKQEFDENRKVFEIMASKLKIEHSDNQLSGIGFSETQRNHLFVKVEGAFKRTLKIIF